MHKIIRNSFIFCLFLLFFASDAYSKLNGIWIPNNIDWRNGSFKTIYIYDDSSFIVISSTQHKNRNGTIEFNTEEGFSLFHGHIMQSSVTSVSIKYRLLYRFIRKENERIPGENISGEFSITNKSGKVSINFDGENYIRTDRYTPNSTIQIKQMASKFVDHILKEDNRRK